MLNTVGLTMSLVAATILYAAFLCQYHIRISDKTSEAPSIAVKDKRQEIYETVEGNSRRFLASLGYLARVHL